jgi:hypothetical protein
MRRCSNPFPATCSNEMLGVLGVDMCVSSASRIRDPRTDEATPRE